MGFGLRSHPSSGEGRAEPNTIVADLKNPKLIYLKGGLFLAILAVSVFLILIESRTWRAAGLVLLVVWSSARLYYFMFYVIEKYVDPTYRFAGVVSFLTYLVRKKK